MSPSNCEVMKEFLVELLYEEISPTRRRELESHLEWCDDCRQELSELQAVRTQLQAAHRLEPPVDSPRVVFLERPRRRGVARYAQLAAAAAVLLVASLGLLNSHIGWTDTGPEISFGLRPAAAGLSAEDRLLVERASVAAEELRAEASSQREVLLAAFRTELERKQRRDADDLEAVLAALLDDLDGRRNHDLRYLMAELGSLEVRTGREMARTHQLLEQVALVSNHPEVGLQR